MNEKTLVIIKPDGVKKKLVGECLARFQKSGLKIVYLKVTHLKKEKIRKFYSHLASKLNSKLFNAIVSFMCSGDVVVAVLEGNNAVSRVGKICGPTNPKQAPRGTIRGDFSSDDLVWCGKHNRPTKNIIHRSGSVSEARDEIKQALSF